MKRKFNSTKLHLVYYMNKMSMTTARISTYVRPTVRYNRKYHSNTDTEY